ncbi:alkyl sulfatase C-terminal domain-containing protein [Nakamurella sp.]|uniref:alkyl sulfatase C-terminal domain-containing protein n=1 Tax=Nakamurella sp. TaxID=1869182 RepID=UPI00378425A4
MGRSYCESPHERCRLRVTNGVLTYSAAAQKGDADATVTTTSRSLPALALGVVSPDKLADAGIALSGDASALARLIAVPDPGDQNAPIVTP